jgi:vanillate/3-O-methylgallate O-demethylase
MTDPGPRRAFVAMMAPERTSAIGPLEYSGWMDEQLSWKQTCYIGDWSFVPQIRFTGPDVIRLFSDLSINSFAKFAIGSAKHCVQCNDDGKVIAEGILIRHGEDDLEYQASTPQWTLYNAKTRGYDVEASFERTHKLQVSGPASLALLEKLTSAGLRDIGFMMTRMLPLEDVDVLFLRQGMAGEIGFELQGPIEHRDRVWDAVVEAGEEFGIRRLGRRTHQINHLEACFPTGRNHFFNALSDDSKADYRRWMDENLPREWVGTVMERFRHNFSEAFTGSWDGESVEELYRSPVEMGWGRSIKLDHDFIGRRALEAELADPRRTVVTLEFDSDDLIRIYASLFSDGDAYGLFEIPQTPYGLCWTDWVLKDGKRIGHSTYPGYSYHYRKGLALSFVDIEHSAPGTPVTVLWGNPGQPQTELMATVRPAPYKPDARRRDLTNDPSPAGTI